MFLENVLCLYRHIRMCICIYKNVYLQIHIHKWDHTIKAICNLIFFFHLTYPRHICVSVDKYILNCFKGGHRTPLYGCMIIYSISSLMTPFLSWSVSLYYKTIIKIYVYLCVTCMSISV